MAPSAGAHLLLRASTRAACSSLPRPQLLAPRPLLLLLPPRPAADSPRSFSRFASPLRLPSDAATQSFKLNHTMLRVKDPEVSLKFYQDVMGMSLIDEHDGGDFKLFFLAYEHQNVAHRAQREGILELTWNKGTEKDDKFAYHNGNDEPQGFGHIAVSVDNLEESCKRFEELGVRFKKRPQDGKMRSIAFIYDPDNYWIEIIPNMTSK